MISQNKAINLFINAFLIAFCIIIIFPVIYSMLVSFQEPRMAFHSLIPKRWTLQHYIRLFSHGLFPRYILNSIIYAIGGAIVSTSLSASAAYALARFQFKGKRLANSFILAMMMLPGLISIIPIYKLASDLKLLDTYTLLIIVFGAYGIPLGIWILKAFFGSIPQVLDEAAFIDGATPIQAFFKVILPITTPGLIATFLINFVYNWNNFFTPLILVTRTNMKMATVGLFDFQHVLEGNQDELLAAACVVIMIPSIILFIVLRDYFMRGMVEGAVKG